MFPNLLADKAGLTEREMGEAVTSCALSAVFVVLSFVTRDGPGERSRLSGGLSRLSSLTPRCKCFAGCVVTRKAINFPRIH